MTPLAPHIEDFLQSRLEREQAASRNTCSSYADTLRLLLEFVSKRVKRSPSRLHVENLSAAAVLRFLEHIERHRKNTASTRNARLAGIKSFMRYLEYRVPAALEQIRRVRAIPFKRTDTRLIPFLTATEWAALVNAAEPSSGLGIRNRALLLLAITGGLRVSELVQLRVDDIQVHANPNVHVRGKGRRERILPLWNETTKAIAAWLRARPTTAVRELFVTTQGHPITRAAVAVLVREHAKRAYVKCPSLVKKRLSPHVLRHTCAMIVLQATGDIRKVALWLGHANIRSTEMYVRADPSEKLKMIEQVLPPSLRRGRFRSTDRLVAFLKQQSLCGPLPQLDE
jgi:integrase/recombinase XerD